MLLLLGDFLMGLGFEDLGGQIMSFSSLIWLFTIFLVVFQPIYNSECKSRMKLCGELRPVR